MSPQQERLHMPEQGFAALFAFLRDAFKKSGLVSIPPQVLHRFRKCPLQGIDCPDIGLFASLFEGSRSTNTYRLEANSFVYTVQIIFYIKPNDFQDKLLHTLMVSVRLLKDEGDAALRLSRLAGREIDRYTVARKRTVISNKLIPWLLKYFAKQSTSARLKIFAAQFLFHLLQGDREAKKILSSAPKKDLWSLGRIIDNYAEPPVRIFAADVLREMSLANIDGLTFWPPDIAKPHDVAIPSSFMADAEWLARVVQYLYQIDDCQPISVRSQPDFHHILSVTTTAISFPGLRSPLIATVSNRISFVLPADQNRPLQIMEIPLMSDVRYRRSHDLFGVNDEKAHDRVELQIQLKSNGYLTWNGLKEMVVEVRLSFHTRSACCDFENAIQRSLQKINSPPQGSILGAEDIDTSDETCRPTKQSRSTLIDFSQDMETSDDTEASLPCGETSYHFLAGVRSDVSPPKPPKRVAFGHHGLEEEMETESTPKISKKARSSKDLSYHWKASKKLSTVNGGEHPDSKDNIDQSTGIQGAVRKSRGKKLRKIVAPATLQCQHALQKDSPPPAKGGLLMSLPSPQTEIKHSAQVSSNLQHLASEALQQSAEGPTSAPHKNNQRLPRLSRGCLHTDKFQSKYLDQRQRSASSVPANSGKRLTLKVKPRPHPVNTSTRKTRQGGSENMRDSTRRAPYKETAGDMGEAAVDWDEDLREESDQATKKCDEISGVNQSRGRKNRSNKSTKGQRSKKAVAPKKMARKTKNRPADTTDNASAADNPPQGLDELLEPPVPLDGLSCAVDNEDLAAQPEHPTARQPVNRQHQAPDETAQCINFDKNSSTAVTVSTAELGGPPALSIFHIAKTEKSHSPLAADHRSGSVQSQEEVATLTNGASPNGIAVTENQKREAENSSPSVQDRALQEVQVVHDSLPMDDNQRADALKKARRSFGSALADIMTAHGVQAIDNPEAALVEKNLVDNKISVAGTAKAPKYSREPSNKAEKNLPSLTAINQPSLSSVGVQQDGSGSCQGDNDDFQHPTLPRNEQPLRTAASLSGFNTEVRDDAFTIMTVTRPAARSLSPVTTEKAIALSFGRHPVADWDERSCQDDEGPIRSGGTKICSEELNATTVDEPLTVRSPKRSNASDLSDNTQGAILCGDMDGTRRIKRARRNSPLLNADVVPIIPPGNIAPSFPEAEEGIQVQTTDDIRLSSSAGVFAENTNAGQAREEIASKQDHEHSPRCERPEILSVVASLIRPLQPDLSNGETAMLMKCDQVVQGHNIENGSDLHHSRGLVKNEGWCHEYSSASRETAKHLAFKKRMQAYEQPAETRKEASLPVSRSLFKSANRRVQFEFPHLASVDEPTPCEESINATRETSHQGAEYKRALHLSKIDENGSPRLHLRPNLLMAPNEDDGLATSSVAFSEESTHTSIPESSGSEWVESNQSSNLKLDEIASSYKDKVQNTTLEDRRNTTRPSIGVGELLDQNFPQASRKIKLKSLKEGSVKAVARPVDVVGSSTTLPEKLYRFSENQNLAGQYEPTNTAVCKEGDAEALFDIYQLGISAADEQSSSAKSGRARRLRSTSASLPLVDIDRPNVSPVSFRARLGKMSMMSHTTREYDGGKVRYGSEPGLYKYREASTMIDAETTLVSGEGYNEDQQICPARRQGQVQLPSLTSSEDVQAITPTSPKQEHAQRLCTDRRFWNQKIAETHQTLTDILEQVSQKILWRFSRAEEGIGFKISHYRYGGRKILNSLVEQFDQRVTEEKRAPSVRLVQHRRRLEGAIDQLQQARRDTRMGPALDALQTSHEKRCDYVMNNLERFAAAQASAG